MKLATRAAMADATEHRCIERLTDDQKRELGRRNLRILYYQSPAPGQPGKCGAQSIDRAAWPGLVILAREVRKPSRLAQNQLAASAALSRKRWQRQRKQSMCQRRSKAGADLHQCGCESSAAATRPTLPSATSRKSVSLSLKCL
jgi:hypothetical protein